MSKTVLITGSSSGIGSATAKYFLQKGWNVAATMRSPGGFAGVSPTQADHWATAENVICPQLDLTQPETIKTAIHETLEQFGRIDVLVNNAGYALLGPLEGVTPEQLHLQFQTNFFGLVTTIQTVLPILRQQGGGTIINVASIGGRLAFALTSPYHASKWAVEGLSESLRYELRRFGIQVKIIEPGGVKTDFVDRSADWGSHPDYTVMVERMKSFSKRLDASLPGPEGVARTIYRAAIDRSGRLRYTPHGEVYFWLHALLPDRVWRSLIENIMLGKSK